MEHLIEAQSDNYRVDLEVFSGPLDLLLYLIKKEEVDIYDIPIAHITRKYLKYVEMMKVLNLEIAGEFILMAATLIRIKTKLLLPRDEDDLEEVDPREELILALVEYKKYKEAGEILREKALIEESFYVPPAPLGKIENKYDLENETSLYDMLTAFMDVLAARRVEAIHEVNPEEISIEDRISVVMKLLSDREGANFRELFADIPRKIVAVVTFIALLELARTRRIKIMQNVLFGELWVYRGDLYKADDQMIDHLDVMEEEETSELQEQISV